MLLYRYVKSVQYMYVTIVMYRYVIGMLNRYVIGTFIPYVSVRDCYRWYNMLIFFLNIPIHSDKIPIDHTDNIPITNRQHTIGMLKNKKHNDHDIPLI